MKDAAPPIMTAARFQAEYREHAGGLCGYLQNSLRGNRALAEDLVQEAFIRAWNNRQSLRDATAFRPWLYSIAMNLLRSHCRKPVREMQVEVDDTLPGVEGRVQAREELERLSEALQELSEEQREAVLLVRVQQMTFAEAALALDVPESTVKTRVRRGLFKLADLLGL
ncbi:RNA polymerase sigma factor [Desulfovibrio ferrophilus]|uniref:RNA polymerase sigma factor n=1 Tax=Desulfovibrio ferrophilus TaxID=241368 RepID=A0A2Z6AYG9_9BACT|nr:RNA polymerase sigma factor [Desulfovibrio ferrophilus]BBD08233.1 RNA polymerase sigma factor [Desulfovibrio ferrophilus]